MQVQEIIARSIITPSLLPAADYVINPYTGCSHGCIYCYARFMKRFSGHEEKWGRFVDVKVNAAELMPRKGEKYRGKRFFLCSVTDPYLPQEKKYGMTRQILNRLQALQPALHIQTKSALITRDIDVLKTFDNCVAGLTLTTLDDRIRKEVEPCTSPVEQRLSALRELKANGIRTYAFIGPILPGLTDWKAILKETRGYTDFYMFENLNAHGAILHDIQDWISESHPELRTLYDDIYVRKMDYWTAVEEEIASFCRKENIPYQIFFHHGRNKKKGRPSP